MVSIRVPDLTAALRERARALGFAGMGVARAAALPDDRRVFEARIAAGMFEGLPWLTAERAGRATDPARALEGAASVVTLAAPYRGTLPVTAAGLGTAPRGRVARYAWGRDYHRVLEKKLKALCAWLGERAPDARTRPLVDYGPLAERAYAARAGLGWTGKSTNLLVPGIGSWVLLADLLTTADLQPDTPLRKHCGACTRCVDGCPTGAIAGPYVLDSRLCISFQTIEQRGPIPRPLRPLMGDWLFGCDICQDVCPVPSDHTMPPMPELGAPDVDAAAPPLLPLLDLDEAAFRARFAGRPLMRAKRDGLLRNACVVLGNVAGEEAAPSLSRALRDPAALVRGHAAWALGRIGAAAARTALAVARHTEPDAWVLDEITSALDDTGRGAGGYDAERLAAWLAGAAPSPGPSPTS
jgi:epoxyqueuosine reductase